MSSKLRKGTLWNYLEKAGVLERGTDAEIKAAKQAYRKDYLLAFKRKQREYKPEYTVNFSKDSGEWDRIAHAAKRHKMTITAFVHAASLAYIGNTYLVPNREQVARLELLLADCLNEIKSIVAKKQTYFWEQDNRIAAIEKRIEKLEQQIDAWFRNPPLHQTNADTVIKNTNQPLL